LGAAIYAGLFEHVAVAEELLFRGIIQTGLARKFGEMPGWIVASLIFGAAHSLNILFLPPNERLGYLAVNVPVITLLGAYLGLVFRHSGYSLVPSTALHFWYDFLLSFGDMALHPQASSLSGRILRLP
jgi:membrane protease YdiL (CAAX protease family)